MKRALLLLGLGVLAACRPGEPPSHEGCHVKTLLQQFFQMKYEETPVSETAYFYPRRWDRKNLGAFAAQCERVDEAQIETVIRALHTGANEEDHVLFKQMEENLAKNFPLLWRTGLIEKRSDLVGLIEFPSRKTERLTCNFPGLLKVAVRLRVRVYRGIRKVAVVHKIAPLAKIRFYAEYCPLGGKWTAAEVHRALQIALHTEYTFARHIRRRGWTVDREKERAAYQGVHELLNREVFDQRFFPTYR